LPRRRTARMKVARAEALEMMGASPVFFRTSWFAAATASGRKRRIQGIELKI
jgi:hypothetical protein